MPYLHLNNSKGEGSGGGVKWEANWATSQGGDWVDNNSHEDGLFMAYKTVFTINLGRQKEVTCST
jgi:hypothetical protein